ncbi:paramyosin isoform X2 [Anthonomus grandis grandis]|uniref:paramyosin isoform X2 n=1 Tax=Anthonomus grandis grandis TaxID=2921223 RepID=UPI002165C7B9|nr:paramyosin isoform X2 [Anthonomus grandis grandis]
MLFSFILLAMLAVLNDIEYEDDFMKNVYFVLQSSILPSDIQNQLLHNIKLCYDLKTKFYESQVLQLVNKFRKELNLHEQKLQHAKRRKMHLEKKVARLEKENQILKNKFENASKEMGPMHTERERLIEQVVTFPCALDHCDINCQTAKADCDLYKKEVEKLKDINQQQKDEIERLKLSYNELLKEFNNCQTKINLVNLRLQEEIDREVQKDPYQKSKSSSSSRSQSITEEILHEARQKLRLLEEESEELDIRFQKFCIA